MTQDLGAMRHRPGFLAGTNVALVLKSVIAGDGVWATAWRRVELIASGRPRWEELRRKSSEKFGFRRGPTCPPAGVTRSFVGIDDPVRCEGAALRGHGIGCQKTPGDTNATADPELAAMPRRTRSQAGVRTGATGVRMRRLTLREADSLTSEYSDSANGSVTAMVTRHGGWSDRAGCGACGTRTREARSPSP